MNLYDELGEDVYQDAVAATVTAIRDARHIMVTNGGGDPERIRAEYVLHAILPDVLAEVWADGEFAGHHNAHEHRHGQQLTNPYWKES